MKIPSTSSILLASLAVSSSALVPPTPDGHRESGLSSSTSHEALATPDAVPPGRRDSISARGLPAPACELVKAVVKAVPLLNLSALKNVLCPSNAKQGEGDGSSADPDKVQAEITQLANVLGNANFPSMPGRVALSVDGSPAAALVNGSPAAALVNGSPAAAPVQEGPAALVNGSPAAAVVNGNPAAAAVNGSPAAAVINEGPAAAPSSGSRAGESEGQSESTASLPSSSSESPSVSYPPMSSSSAWRVQPTPTNSPALPIDDPAYTNATTSSYSAASTNSLVA